MSFRDVYAERVQGFAPIYNQNPTIGAPGSPPLFLLNNLFQGASYWIYGTAAGIGTTDTGGTHTDLTPASSPPSGINSEQWTGCELNGFPVMNYQNGSGPHSWDRNLANKFIQLPVWPAATSCKIIRSHRFYLMALNIGGATELPSVIRWSDSAAPGNLPTTWTPAVANDAGSLSLGDTGEGITDGLTIGASSLGGSRFIVYKTNSTYFMDYVANRTTGQDIFGQGALFTTTGALSTNCVTTWNNQHVVLTDGDVIMHDGQGAIRSLVDRSTRRAIFSNIDQTNYERSFVINDRVLDQIIVCYPENGASYPNRALLIDMQTNSVRFRDTNEIYGGGSFRDTRIGGSGTPHIATGNVSTSTINNLWSNITTKWNTDTNIWSYGEIQAATDGLVGIDFDDSELVRFNNGANYTTGTLNASATKLTFDFGDASRGKYCGEVRPRIVGTAGQIVQCRVGSQENTDEPVNWGSFREFVIGTDQYVDADSEGKYLSFQFQTSAGNNWRIAGFDALIDLTGAY
jgi:hypothetical protein